MQSILKFNIIIFVLSFALQDGLCQSRIILEKIYFGSDIFIPFTNDEKNIELELSYTSFGWPHQFVFNYKAAYSPINNLAIKLNYRNNTEDGNIGSHLISINEANIGLGYFTKLTTRRAQNSYDFKMEKLENRYKAKKLSRMRWRNSWRESKGKKPKNLNRKFIRPESFLFSIYAGYGLAYMKGKSGRFIFPGPGVTETKTADYNLERYNADIGLTYLTSRRFTFAYYLRASLVNYKKIEYFNPSGDLLSTFDIVNRKDPYIAFDSNFKITLSTKKIDYFIKFNDIIGKQNRIINSFNATYADFNYNLNFNIGLTLNL